jgi:hypothetical protein
MGRGHVGGGNMESESRVRTQVSPASSDINSLMSVQKISGICGLKHIGLLVS